MRKPLAGLFVVIHVLSALLLAACGSSEKTSPGALSPAGAAIYAELNFKPGGEQKAALDKLAAGFPGSGSAGQRIGDLLDRGFREENAGVTFGQDVKPWLGDNGALFASNPESDGDFRSVAAVVATKDEQASLDFVKKAAKGDFGPEREYQGKKYNRVDASDNSVAGVVDGYLVVGTEPGFKAAVDAAGDGKPIDDAQAYKDAQKGTPSDRLGSVFINSPVLAKQLEKVGGGANLSGVRRLLRDPYLTTLSADNAGLELAAVLPPSLASYAGPFLGAGTDLVGDLPGDAWAAVGAPDLGKTLDRSIDLFADAAGGRSVIESQLRQAAGLDLQRDVIDWMGDYGLFVTGDSPSTLEGALVVETKDPSASKKTIASGRKLLARQARGASVSELSAPGGGDGFTVRESSLPKPLHVFQKSGKVVIAFGNGAARQAVSPSEKLSDNPDFDSALGALGAGYQGSTFVSVPSVVQLIEGAGGTSTKLAEAKRYLEAFGAIVGGTKKDGDKLQSRVRITTK